MSGAGQFFPSVSSEGNHLHALSAVPINDELADDERDVLKEFVELCPVDGVTQTNTLMKRKMTGGKQKKKRKGEPKPPKEFQRTSCKCWFHCDKIPEEALRKVFEQFQKMKTWNEQSVFISSLICEGPVMNHRCTNVDKRRTKSMKYYLGDYQVCKKVFATTLGITMSRISYLVDVKKKDGIVFPDKRGKKMPGVKKFKNMKKFSSGCQGSFGNATDVSLADAANAAASGMLGDYNAPCGTVFAPGMYHFLDPKSGSSIENMMGTTPKMEAEPDQDDGIDPKSFRKLLRQRGLSYVSRQGKLIPPATFKFERCFCTNECHTLPEEDRREIFENFWLLGSWDVQSAFLRSHMVEVPVKDNPRTAAKKRRTRVVHYYLKDTRVCKKTFANTLCVTQSRLDYLITAKAVPCGALIQDMRGRKIPGNKVPDRTYTKINEFLTRFPKYKSVRSRDKVYFHFDLTKKELHQRFCEEYPNYAISMFIFRQALKRYNIDIYSLDSDSCSKCDRFSSKRRANMSFEERVQLAEESHHHEQKTTEARAALKKCETVARSDPRHLCFTFSLGRTQSLPHLSVPIAACKRRMWLFNLGINDRRDNSAYLCMWTEVDGKCGSDEVASSLLEYLNRRPLNSYSAISTFSDSFGGTNWKKTLVALQMYVCGTSAVESWTHTFLESGHSLLPNDADFAKIEKSKKIKENIYDYDHWTLNIMECRFNILHMKGRFLKVSQLTNLHTFRELDFYHEPFSWSDVKWLRVTRGNTVVEFKTSLAPDHPSRWVDLAKALPTERVGTLEKLHLQPIKISKEKYMDVLSLGEYLPAPSYNYYKSMPHKDRDGGVEHFPGEEIKA